jgi:hypothetical protein
MVALGGAGEERRDDGDAERGAQVAHQVVEPGGAAHLLVAQGADRHRRERHEDEPQGEAGHDVGQDDVAHAHGELEAAEHEGGQREHGEARRHQPATVHPGRQPSDDHHRGHGGPRGLTAMPLCSAGYPSSVCRKSGRSERGVEHRHDRDQQQGDGEVAVGRCTIVAAMRSSRTMKPARATAAVTASAHGDAGERVDLLALVEQDLQRRQPQRHQRQPQHVDAPASAAAQVGRVLHERLGHDHGQVADGEVDIEDPAPGVVVGDEAAQSGADDGRDHDAHAVHGHGHAPPLGGKLSSRTAWASGCSAAAGALHHARDVDHAGAGGRAGEQRGAGKDDDAGREEPLAAEHAGEPAGGGQDDRVRGRGSS